MPISTCPRDNAAKALVTFVVNYVTERAAAAIQVAYVELYEHVHSGSSSASISGQSGGRTGLENTRATRLRAGRADRRSSSPHGPLAEYFWQAAHTRISRPLRAAARMMRTNQNAGFCPLSSVFVSLLSRTGPAAPMEMRQRCKQQNTNRTRTWSKTRSLWCCGRSGYACTRNRYRLDSGTPYVKHGFLGSVAMVDQRSVFVRKTLKRRTLESKTLKTKRNRNKKLLYVLMLSGSADRTETAAAFIFILAASSQRQPEVAR